MNVVKWVNMERIRRINTENYVRKKLERQMPKKSDLVAYVQNKLIAPHLPSGTTAVKYLGAGGFGMAFELRNPTSGSQVLKWLWYPQMSDRDMFVKGEEAVKANQNAIKNEVEQLQQMDGASCEAQTICFKGKKTLGKPIQKDGFGTEGLLVFMTLVGDVDLQTYMDSTAAQLTDDEREAVTNFLALRCMQLLLQFHVEKKRVHRDIKPPNLRLTLDQERRLPLDVHYIDLGFTCRYEQYAKNAPCSNTRWGTYGDELKGAGFAYQASTLDIGWESERRWRHHIKFDESAVARVLEIWMIKSKCKFNPLLKKTIADLRQHGDEAFRAYVRFMKHVCVPDTSATGDAAEPSRPAGEYQ